MTVVKVGYLLLTNVDPRKWHAPITTKTQVVGRDLGCDIVIPSEFRTVSRRHAEFEFKNDNLWIQDLGSSGGTRLNGVPLVAKRPSHIVVGDRLWLSGLEMLLVSPDSPSLETGILPAGKDTKSTDANGMFGIGAKNSMEGTALDCLTAAEMDVIRWMSRGITTYEDLSKKLFRSPHTVRTQMRNIFAKLHMHSREELIGWLRKIEISWTTPIESPSPSPAVIPPETTDQDPVYRDTLLDERSIVHDPQSEEIE